MGVNNITKEDAQTWIKENRNGFPPHRISELILRRCFYGEDFFAIAGEDLSYTMSFIGRAYNITAYGTASNRIKNVYAKYIRQGYESDRIADAVSQIVQQYPNGISDETPRFEDLLQQYLNSTDDSEMYDFRADIHEDEFGFLNNSTEGNSSLKVGRIVMPLVAIIVLVVLVVSLRNIILPILGVVAVIGLVVFVYKNMKGGQKNNSSTPSSRAFNGTKRNQHSTAGMGKISFGKLAGAVAWGGIFIYAGTYYHNAGNPSSWSVAAFAIGIVGACVILFGSKKK